MHSRGFALLLIVLACDAPENSSNLPELASGSPPAVAIHAPALHAIPGAARIEDLSWIEGRWYGTTPTGALIFQSYTRRDHQIILHSYADARFANPIPTATISEENNRIIQRAGTRKWVAIDGEEGTITFKALDQEGGTLTWIPRSAGVWEVVVEDKPGLSIRYVMQRFK